MRQYKWNNEVPQSPTIERNALGVELSQRSIHRRKACGAGGDVMKSEAKPMRLSEAIRLGAMMKPQAFGVLIDDDNGRTYALGAAYDAVGIKFDASGLPNGYLDELVLWLHRIIELEAATCPECGVNTPAIGLIPHLNDAHRWTRQRIADFVERYETLQIPESAERAVNGWPEQHYETLRAAVRADVVLAVNKETGELSILWGKPLLETIRDFDQADQCKVVLVPIDFGEDCDDLEQLAALVQVERGSMDLIEECK